uniref:Uncharacterized protein n=1 Tax=Magallana gigas TaxID=29159 RepID=A0A8W8KBQ2_MAGGI
RTVIFLTYIKKRKGRIDMCMFSVSTYYEGILKLKPICQRDIYHLLDLMKGRNNKNVLVVAPMLKKVWLVIFTKVLIYFQNGVEEGSVFQMHSSVFCTSISILRNFWIGLQEM